MKRITNSKIDVIKFLVNKNREVHRGEMLAGVNQSVRTATALRKIVDEDEETMGQMIAIRDMNEDDPHLKQKKIGYSLKGDIETFGKLFFDVYEYNDRWELLRTPYFNDLLDIVMNNFEGRLNSLNIELTSDERKYIKSRIRYPSVLRAMLCENVDLKNMIYFKKTQRKSTVEFGAEFLSKWAKSKRIPKAQFKQIKEPLEVFFHHMQNQTSPIMQIFDGLMQHDRLMLHAESDISRLKIDEEYQAIITGEIHTRITKQTDGGVFKEICSALSNVT